MELEESNGEYCEWGDGERNGSLFHIIVDLAAFAALAALSTFSALAAFAGLAAVLDIVFSSDASLWDDPTFGDGAVAQELAQFVILEDGELHVARVDTGLFVFAAGVTSEFEDFCGEVFEDCREVNWCCGTNTSCVTTLL